jgi:hypothetical protein
MTAHYLVAQVAKLVAALKRITDDRHRAKRSLAMMARKALWEEVPMHPPWFNTIGTKKGRLAAPLREGEVQ